MWEWSSSTQMSYAFSRWSRQMCFGWAVTDGPGGTGLLMWESECKYWHVFQRLFWLGCVTVECTVADTVTLILSVPVCVNTETGCHTCSFMQNEHFKLRWRPEMQPEQLWHTGLTSSCVACGCPKVQRHDTDLATSASTDRTALASSLELFWQEFSAAISSAGC